MLQAEPHNCSFPAFTLESHSDSSIDFEDEHMLLYDLPLSLTLGWPHLCSQVRVFPAFSITSLVFFSRAASSSPASSSSGGLIHAKGSSRLGRRTFTAASFRSFSLEFFICKLQWLPRCDGLQEDGSSFIYNFQ
jgi:hypothetical protein